jgi:hypothetical protein
MNSKITLRVFSTLTEALGCFCLYFGTAMLFVVPGDPGEPFLVWSRIKYGIAPTVLSVALICLAGWLWSRSGPSLPLSTYVKRAFQGALAALVLLWAGLIVVAHVYGTIP